MHITPLGCLSEPSFPSVTCSINWSVEPSTIPTLIESDSDGLIVSNCRYVFPRTADVDNRAFTKLELLPVRRVTAA